MFAIFANAQDRQRLETAWADWQARTTHAILLDAGEVPPRGYFIFQARGGLLIHQPDWTLSALPLLFWKPAFEPAELCLLASAPAQPTGDRHVDLFKELWHALAAGEPLPSARFDEIFHMALQAQDSFFRHAWLHNLRILALFDLLEPASEEQLFATEEATHSLPAALPPAHGHLFELVTCVWLQNHEQLQAAQEVWQHRLAPICEDLPEEARLVVQALAVELKWPAWIGKPEHPDYPAFKESLWNAVEALKDKPRLRPHRASLLETAAHFALSEGSYSEALGYLNEALAIVETLDEPTWTHSLLARKGEVLLAWAQIGGQAQFYDQALKVFQQVAHQIDPSQTPELYAEIQQQIGTIFTHKPVDEKKRGIMAGMAEAAFQEALEVAQQHQLEQLYARICNNYGNALQHFPDSRFTDKYEKALFFYQQALDRRPASQFPTERAYLLANYIQAALQMRHLDADQLDELRRHADEMQRLSDAPELRQLARSTLQLVEQMKKEVPSNDP